MNFYATFTPGLGEPVSHLVSERGLRVELLMDGALLYEADQPHLLPCFINVFVALKWKRISALNANTNPLMPFMKAAAEHPTQFGLAHFPREGASLQRTFRIVTSVENKLVSVDANVKRNLERIIEARTGLTTERGGAGEEFWFLYRSEGYVFFLRRLTTHTAYEKTLRKGELRPEVAFLLNALSDPDGDDVFLDPFCGYGSIPAARLRYFPCKEIHASDGDEGFIGETQIKLSSVSKVARTARGQAPAEGARTPLVRCRHADIGALDLPPESVDRIVTDPPWGLYAPEGTQPPDIRPLYEKMFNCFLQVVKRGGVIVILTSRKELVRELLLYPENEGIKLLVAYDILVSGKKAGVFKLLRGH